MIISKKYKGLVTKKFNDFFLVDLNEKDFPKNKQRFLCKIRKSVSFKNQLIFVGDYVIIDQIDLKNKSAIIESLLARKNLLYRPSVANISNIYITFSVDEPQLNFSQVNNFLICAEQLKVDISLVLTKCDLISNEKKLFLLDKFRHWGYSVFTSNLENKVDFQKFLSELNTKQCSILMGPSGVGKTTLLNQIIPGISNTTAPVSTKIKRGKNTTRNVELFELSSKSYVVDTPGFNMPKQPIDIREVAFLFPEIKKQILSNDLTCRFRDCLHIHEPGCNLNKDFDRYYFYKEMIKFSKTHHPPIQED